jgi:two-component system, NarL family, invasion response regulator UvrY
LIDGEALIRVLLVDNFKPWHNLVTAALESDARYKVVGFATDEDGAVSQCQALAPNLIILEMNSDGWNGLSAARKIRGIVPEAQMVFFTNDIFSDFVTAAFVVGARGFVAKRDFHELLQAVNKVMSGEQYLSERVKNFYDDPERSHTV